MTLEEEITLYERKDESEILNMFTEKQFIYSSNNKIKASTLFETFYIGYLDRRLKIGLKRMELYKARKLK